METMATNYCACVSAASHSNTYYILHTFNVGLKGSRGLLSTGQLVIIFVCFLLLTCMILWNMVLPWSIFIKQCELEWSCIALPCPSPQHKIIRLNFPFPSSTKFLVYLKKRVECQILSIYYHMRMNNNNNDWLKSVEKWWLGQTSLLFSQFPPWWKLFSQQPVTTWLKIVKIR